MSPCPASTRLPATFFPDSFYCFTLGLRSTDAHVCNTLRLRSTDAHASTALRLRFIMFVPLHNCDLLKLTSSDLPQSVFLKYPIFFLPHLMSPAPLNLPRLPPTVVPTQVFAELVTDSALAAALYSQSALGKDRPGKTTSSPSTDFLSSEFFLRKAVRIHKKPLILMSNFHFKQECV